MSAAKQFKQGHGVLITAYDPGLITDRTEENVNYELSAAQTDIFDGFCTCTVGSDLGKVLFGGGLVPTRRPIQDSDKVLAIPCSTSPHSPLRPNDDVNFNKIAQRLKIKVYVKDMTRRIVWVFDGISKTEWQNQ
ncbi:Uncharacterised protein [BD1-7 clade bacterium]|uniref:Uncharacterized protein n=1 Tax=BD1-7 clade bacterium TaxID=2029982 RepID=A0A5S9QYZ9_9GAMM|nr:Uncharacterised protein [BD1-7 clade bacterium]